MLDMAQSVPLPAGEAQVDAHALLLTCCVAIYMGFPFGMSTAATIRVGNLVGANRPHEARLSGKRELGVEGCAALVLLQSLQLLHAHQAIL